MVGGGMSLFNTEFARLSQAARILELCGPQPDRYGQRENKTVQQRIQWEKCVGQMTQSIQAL
jgi:hypothetical protein